MTYIRILTGWLPIQIRRDPSFDFNRDYVDYVEGFGDPLTDYWMSLTEMHDLTLTLPAILYIRFEDRTGGVAWAIYDTFSVDDASSNFRVTITGYKGTAGDCLTENNGMEFSARDVDNDPYGVLDCAVTRESGFWFGDSLGYCGGANPNGRLDVVEVDKEAAHWYWHQNNFVGLKYFEMYICSRS